MIDFTNNSDLNNTLNLNYFCGECNKMYNYKDIIILSNGTLICKNCICNYIERQELIENNLSEELYQLKKKYCY